MDFCLELSVHLVCISSIFFIQWSSLSPCLTHSEFSIIAFINLYASLMSFRGLYDVSMKIAMRRSLKQNEINKIENNTEWQIETDRFLYSSTVGGTSRLNYEHTNSLLDEWWMHFNSFCHIEHNLFIVFGRLSIRNAVAHWVQSFIKTGN